MPNATPNRQFVRAAPVRLRNRCHTKESLGRPKWEKETAGHRLIPIVTRPLRAASSPPSHAPSDRNSLPTKRKIGLPLQSENSWCYSPFPDGLP